MTRLVALILVLLTTNADSTEKSTFTRTALAPRATHVDSVIQGDNNDVVSLLTLRTEQKQQSALNPPLRMLLTTTELLYPISVIVDSSDNLYIADHGNERILHHNVLLGQTTTVAGNGTSGFSGDNGLATQAELAGPYDVALDAHNNLYIADLNNNRVRLVNASTGIITTVAGTGDTAYSGDNGPAT
jgi:hypothetical protein